MFTTIKESYVVVPWQDSLSAHTICSFNVSGRVYVTERIVIKVHSYIRINATNFKVIVDGL